MLSASGVVVVAAVDVVLRELREREFPGAPAEVQGRRESR